MFVGRSWLLDQIVTGTNLKFSAKNLSGSLGAGKTSILQHLKDALASRPILVNLEEFNPGHRGEHGSHISVGAVQGSFQQFSDLLNSLIQRTCSQETLARFKADVVNARNAEVLGARVPGFKEAMADFNGTLHPQDLVNAWRSAQAVVANRFVTYWNAAVPTQGRMLLLDNVDEITDQEIGTWMAELLPRLARTTVVLTRTPNGSHFPLLADDVRVFEVADFDEKDVCAYLARAAREARREPVQEFVAKRVYEVSGGHPATLAAVYELLWGSRAAPDTNPLQLLDDLPEQPNEKAAVLIERLVSDDDALERALWAAAVPRRLDATLLKYLLADSPLPPADQKRVFEELRRFQFTENLLPGNSYIRLHSYVRDGLLQRMWRTDTERFNALHERAAKHYGRHVTKAFHEGSAYRYTDAFDYEKLKWQRNKREWLYHRGHALTEDAQHNALLEFTRVFFDAFWWWGNYIHFGFCDQLITDLEHLARQRTAEVAGEDAWPDLETLHQALRRILRSYPLRAMKPKDADWEGVWNALLMVQQLCGLQGLHASQLTTKTERHVAALLFVFIAHTWRYRAPELPEADKYYSQAADLFAKDKDWSEAWVAFERADLRFERGETTAIHVFWKHASDLVDPDDHELMSNLHRLRGDCCWASGDRAGAATWYGWAVLHAYRFHLVGGPPDDYTLQFYIDIRARALNRLLHVWEQDHDTAIALAIEMARAFPTTHGLKPHPTPDQLRPLLTDAADGKPLPLAGVLFPRGPEIGELGRVSQFTEEYNELVAAVDWQQAAYELRNPKWP